MPTKGEKKGQKHKQGKNPKSANPLEMDKHSMKSRAERGLPEK